MDTRKSPPGAATPQQAERSKSNTPHVFLASRMRLVYHGGAHTASRNHSPARMRGRCSIGRERQEGDH